MKKSICAFVFLMAFGVMLKGQNYLFDKGKSGISGGLGLFTEKLKTVDAYAFHLEYTFNGRFSLGYNRTFVTGVDGGRNSFNASYCIIKRQNDKSSLNVPVFIGLTGLDKTVFSYGVGMSFLNRTSESIKIAPTFSILRTKLPKSYYLSRDGYTSIGFELNIISENIRLTPNVTFSTQNTLFGIDAGFLFQR